MTQDPTQPNKKLKERVLDVIATDQVTMRSRYYFLARTALWVAGLVLAFALTLYLLSFVAFVFRGNGLHLLVQLGAPGWGALFASLPWLVLLAVFVVFVLLQMLSTHFAFVYKRPLVHTMLGSIFILVIGSVAIAHTALHERAYRLSEEGRLPLGKPLYQSAMHNKDNLHIGTIRELGDDSFELLHRNGEVYEVYIKENTRLPKRALQNGDIVMVLGPTDDDEIEAIGIRPFKQGDALFPPPRRNHNQQRPTPAR